MTITREQVADLQTGDVVQYHHWDWPDGITVSGPLYRSKSGALLIGNDPIRLEDGDVRSGDHWKGTLTVVSRAPRPLYVNHDRDKSRSGDVVRDADDQGDPMSWNCVCGTWYGPDGISWSRGDMPARLRLLVDGETGQVVP